MWNDSISYVVRYGERLPAFPVATVYDDSLRPLANVRVGAKIGLEYGGWRNGCPTLLELGEFRSDSLGRVVVSGDVLTGACGRTAHLVLTVATDTSVTLKRYFETKPGRVAEIELSYPRPCCGVPGDTVLAFNEHSLIYARFFDRFGNEYSREDSVPSPVLRADSGVSVEWKDRDREIALVAGRSGRVSVEAQVLEARASVRLEVMDSSVALFVPYPRVSGGVSWFQPTAEGALHISNGQVSRLNGARWDSSVVVVDAAQEYVRDLAVSDGQLVLVGGDKGPASVALSTDGGRTFDVRSIGTSDNSCVAAHPTHGVAVVRTFVKPDSARPTAIRLPLGGDTLSLPELPVRVSAPEYVFGCDVAFAPDGTLYAVISTTKSDRNPYLPGTDFDDVLYRHDGTQWIAQLVPAGNSKRRLYLVPASDGGRLRLMSHSSDGVVSVAHLTGRGDTVVFATPPESFGGVFFWPIRGLDGYLVYAPPGLPMRREGPSGIRVVSNLRARWQPFAAADQRHVWTHVESGAGYVRVSTP